MRNDADGAEKTRGLFGSSGLDLPDPAALIEGIETKDLSSGTIPDWLAAFDAIDDVAFLRDPTGTILWCNKAAHRIADNSSAEIVGSKCWELVHNTTEPTENCPLLIMKELSEPRMLLIQRDDRLLKAIVHPFLDHEFRLCGSLHVLKDITLEQQTGCVDLHGFDLTEHIAPPNELWLSQEKYRAIFESTGTAVALIEEDTTISMINTQFEKISGYSKREIVGKSWTDFMAPEDLLRMKQYHLQRRTNPNDVPSQYECRYLHKSGITKDMLLTVSMVPGTSRSVASVIDVTELKEIEKKLKRTSEEQTMLLDSIDTQIWYLTDPCTYGAVNRSHANFLGKAKLELQGKNYYEFLDKETADICIQINEEVFATKKQICTLEWAENSRGELRLLEFTKTPKLDAGGDVEFVVCSAVDVTEQKQAEEKIKASESRFRELFNNMSSGVAVYEATDGGKDFIFKDFNKAGEKIDGMKKQDAVGRSVLQVFPAVKEFGLFEVFQRVWQTGQPEHHPISLYQDDRMVGWRTNYVYKLASGEIVAVYDDVTDRIKALENLRESKELFEKVFLSLASAVFILEDKIRPVITDCNPAASEIFGYEKREMLGKTPEFLHMSKETNKQFEDRLWAAIATEGRLSFLEFKMKRANGEVFPTTHSVLPLLGDCGETTGWVSTVRDISKQKEAEEESIKSQIQLQNQKIALEQKNIALREMIEQVSMERNKIEASIVLNVNEALMPILRDLEGKGIPSKYLDLIKHELNKLTSPFAQKVHSKSDKLTARELEICHLIESNLTSKEISNLLNISLQTVEKHRRNIRKKLGIANKDVNLATFLHNGY